MIQIGQIILFKVSSNPMTQSQMFFRNLPVAALTVPIFPLYKVIENLYYFSVILSTA
jgi:hypothetical protein